MQDTRFERDALFMVFEEGMRFEDGALGSSCAIRQGLEPAEVRGLPEGSPPKQSRRSSPQPSIWGREPGSLLGPRIMCPDFAPGIWALFLATLGAAVC